MKPILIDALHICMGGGLMILDYLVDSLLESKVNFSLLKDIRCPKLSSEDKIQSITVLPSDIKIRKSYYHEHQNDFSAVLCFGNIPPAIRLNVPVHTYLHNVSLLRIPADYGTVKKVKSYFKRRYIKHFSCNTDTWIVQTDNTASLVREKLAERDQPIEVFPFFRIPKDINRTKKERREDYVFIGDYTSAKGHEYLVDAWEKLYQRGFNCTLHLTVSEPKFIKVIDSAISRGVKICNHGKISFDKVIELYNKSKAIVYPSLNESLGLGIVEALKAGCDVIGCNLPYMNSICIPSVVFEPYSSDSIVDAVLKYESGEVNKSNLKIGDKVTDFIKYLKCFGQND